MNSRKKLVFGGVLSLFLLGIVELFSLSFVLLRADLFQDDAMADLRRQANPEAYARFLKSSYDAELGWDNHRTTSRDSKNCLGLPVRYSFNDAGARETGSARPFDILVVGDSYSFGHEANNEDSYPYRLAKQTGRSVGNYGVAGYGPFQAVLKFERLLETHLNASIAILGITYENIRRMPNSFRLAYHAGTGLIYNFKPYIDLEEDPPVPRPNPNVPPAQELDAFLALAEQAFANDYWRRPAAAFPYSLSVTRLVLNRHIQQDLLKKPRRFLGAGDYAGFQSGPARTAITMVIERFLDAARNAGMKPVVLFTPLNGHDTTSPRELVAALRQTHEDAIFIDTGAAPIDWQRYNLDDTACHPSAYGYDQIAQAVARALDGAD